VSNIVKELVLPKDKVTPGGKVRYGDGNHNIYLMPDEVKELGSPDSIFITITPYPAGSETKE